MGGCQGLTQRVIPGNVAPHGESVQPCGMSDAVQQKLVTLRILWGAMLGSLAIFVVVLFVVRSQGGASGSPPPAMIAVLGAMALGMATASVIVPRKMFRTALAAQKFELGDQPLPGAFGQYRAESPTERVFAEPRKAFSRALTLYQTPFILGCAFGEAAALDGFILGFLGAPVEIVAVFFAVGAAAIAEKHPSIAFVTKQLEAAYDAKMPA